MKVNDRGAKSVTTTPAQLRAKELEKNLKNNKSGESANAGNISSSAKVNVSPEAQAIQKAKAIASKDSIDEAKVAKLQKMIDDGQYKVNAKAVADRLVDEQLATGE